MGKIDNSLYDSHNCGYHPCPGSIDTKSRILDCHSCRFRLWRVLVVQGVADQPACYMVGKRQDVSGNVQAIG
jgi:hypothetical protein